MARSLRDDTDHGNLTKGTFLEFVGKHDDIDTEIANAQETMRSLRRRKKDIRSAIEANGISIDEFDRSLKDRARSDDELEASTRQYQRNLAWLNKPLNFQSDLGLPPDTAKDTTAANLYRLKQVDIAGHTAGRAGHDARGNPHNPGTEEFARWQNAWVRGQGDKVHAEIKPTDPTKRGRGRPRKTAETLPTTKEEPPLPLAAGEAEPPTLVQPEPPHTPGLPQSDSRLH